MPTRHVVTFAGTAAGFEEAAARVRSALEAHPVSSRMQYNVELVFEEIATNIIRHGLAREPAASDVRVELELGEPLTVLTFEDSGMPFDPRDQADPARPGGIEEAKVGGLGLVLVRKAVSRIDYERTPQGRNRLTLTIAA